MIGELTVPRAEYEQMLRHLQSAYPLEGCGLLAGLRDLISRLYAVENRLHSAVAFEMDPQQQLDAMLALEADGLEMLAIYHSHPQGPQTPSATDVAQAYYPGVVHVIVSLANRDCPSVRAFTIEDGQVDEIELHIV